MAVVGLPVVVLFFVEEDVADDLYDAAEAAGLDAMIRGLSLTQTDPEIA